MTPSSQLQELKDNELIELYQKAENRDALNELLKRYYHSIYGACCKVLNNQEDAKDVCLDVCESLIKTLKTEKIAYFSSWLYSVCHNKSVSFIRQRETKRKHQREIEKSAEIVVENQGLLRLTSESQPHLKIDRAKEQLAAYMSDLPQAQRKCLQLFYFKRMSYAQIAKATKSDVRQVKSHLQSGKRKLRLLYEKSDKN